MSTTGVAPARGNAEARELARWQRKLLPFMSRFLVILAIAFFALSIFDVYEMRSFVRNESSQAIRGIFDWMYRILPKCYELSDLSTYYIDNGNIANWWPVWSTAAFLVGVMGLTMWLLHRKSF